jgi:hypothetical protein
MEVLIWRMLIVEAAMETEEAMGWRRFPYELWELTRL